MYTATSIKAPRARRRGSARILITGLLASAGLAASVSPAVAALADHLVPASPAAHALAVRQEVAGSSVATEAGPSNSAALASGNAYGGATLSAGGSTSQTVAFTNTGAAPVTSLSAHASPCSQVASGPVAGTAKDLCDKVSVQVSSAGATVFTGTATAFGSAGGVDVLERSGRGPVPPGQRVEIVITVTLSPALDNRYQGLEISQPITWRFGA